jgi:hypothetical protein
MLRYFQFGINLYVTATSNNKLEHLGMLSVPNLLQDY